MFYFVYIILDVVVCQLIFLFGIKKDEKGYKKFVVSLLQKVYVRFEVFYLYEREFFCLGFGFEEIELEVLGYVIKKKK